MPTPIAADATAALTTAYNVTDARLTRVPAGQVTINYQAQTADGHKLFVKQYTPDADLSDEAAAIAQTQLAERHGVPVAHVLLTTEGQTIARTGRGAISVWEWVAGVTVDSGLNAAQQTETGRTLGAIHRAFAQHPASAETPHRFHAWRSRDLSKLHVAVDGLLRTINESPRAEWDDFDVQAAHTLAERQKMLHRMPELRDELPDLSCQVLHGDYSAVNLLFDGDQLAAVLDFRPPEPFPIAYELGRIAFDPRSVALTDNWITAGRTLVAAYLQENPSITEADVRFCARVQLITLVTSLYGVKQHYQGGGLLQDDLDAFWLLRHKAAQRLLEHLGEAEEALAHTFAQT
ncbi:phosphotransferase [Streptomyces durbertensis]|uniref:Phosphotransferase n=1 Tax=Streptomyces durbertensis TaxID=2448886 RepID=A0ABR6EI40_9ACTN|nr:phosphotransferase [Streptomyces durbertensis]MBB1244928.1 phosphotransferase [Streptomyces durbertensis]